MSKPTGTSSTASTSFSVLQQQQNNIKNEYGKNFVPLLYRETLRNDFAIAVIQLLYHTTPTREYFRAFSSLRQFGRTPIHDSMKGTFDNLENPSIINCTASIRLPDAVPETIKIKLIKEFSENLSDDSNKSSSKWNIPLPPGPPILIHSVDTYMKQIFFWVREECIKTLNPISKLVSNSSKLPISTSEKDWEIFSKYIDPSPLKEYFMVQSEILYLCTKCDQLQLHQYKWNKRGIRKKVQKSIWFYDYIIQIDPMVDKGSIGNEISLNDYLGFIYDESGDVSIIRIIIIFMIITKKNFKFFHQHQRLYNDDENFDTIGFNNSNLN